MQQEKDPKDEAPETEVVDEPVGEEDVPVADDSEDVQQDHS